MKKYLFSLVCFFPVMLFAQLQTTNSNFELSLVAGSTAYIKDPVFIHFNGWLGYSDSYKPQTVNHQIGIKFAKTKKALGWSAGLLFSQQNYQNISWVEFGEPIIRNQKVNYLDIPLEIRYAISKGKWRASFSAGIQTSIRVDQNAEYKKGLISPIIGGEIDYFIAPNWSLMLGANFQKRIMNPIAIPHITAPNGLGSQLGIQVGTRFHF